MRRIASEIEQKTISLFLLLLDSHSFPWFGYRGNERSQEQAFDRGAHVNLHPPCTAQRVGRVADEKGAHESPHHREQGDGHDVLKEGLAAAGVARFEDEWRQETEIEYFRLCI